MVVDMGYEMPDGGDEEEDDDSGKANKDEVQPKPLTPTPNPKT